MSNARHWIGICYPENMIDNWEDEIEDILQLPFAYCIHDKDTLIKEEVVDGVEVPEEDRKVHVHIIVIFNNTTTQKNALNVLNRLSKEGAKCCSTVEQIISIRHMYEYLIHNTKKAIKDGKHKYDISERICGNNFDIGAYEQVSVAERNRIIMFLSQAIRIYTFTNFYDFCEWVELNFSEDILYFEIMRTNSGFFERKIRGLYLKLNPPRKPS